MSPSTEAAIYEAITVLAFFLVVGSLLLMNWPRITVLRWLLTRSWRRPEAERSTADALPGPAAHAFAAAERPLLALGCVAAYWIRTVVVTGDVVWQAVYERPGEPWVAALMFPGGAPEAEVCFVTAFQDGGSLLTLRGAREISFGLGPRTILVDPGDGDVPKALEAHLDALRLELAAGRVATPETPEQGVERARRESEAGFEEMLVTGELVARGTGFRMPFRQALALATKMTGGPLRVA